MKTKLFILFVICIFSFAKAQEKNCTEKQNQLSQFVTNQEYVKALDTWNEIKSSCTVINEKTYLVASKVLQYNIEVATAENKQKEADELMQLYNQYDKVFPENKNGNFVKSAMILYENKIGTNDEIYDFLNKGFEKQRPYFNNPEALIIYFEMYFNKYKLDKSPITIDNLLDKYNDVTALSETNSLQFPEKADQYSRVIVGMNSLMTKVLTSENMISYAQKNFETKKSNIYWLATTAKALSVSSKGAQIFGTIAQELHTLTPSSKSAYYLAIYNLNTGKQDKAISFFTQSALLATDTLEKATTYYTIASMLSTSDKTTSQKMVLSAIENNPYNGRYYIFLANLYANSVAECATNENEKKAIYKLAAITVLKAAAVEPRLKPTADQLSNEYMKNVVFDKKTKVTSVKIECWINQTVQF